MRTSKRKKQHQGERRKMALREKLRASYHEQELLVQQQYPLLTELGQLYRELMHLALTDAITDLPNHRAVMSRLHEAVARGPGAQKSCAVLFVDLDQFKRVNDTWGHRAGDWLLYEVACRLRGAVRSEDFVGRYGGEEFVILLPEVDLQTASQMAADVHSVIVSPPYSWQLEAGSSAVPIFISIAASIGAAISPLHGGSAEALIEAADRAMYQAKSTGGGVCVADTEMTSLQARLSRPDPTRYTVEVAAQVLAAVISASDQQTGGHAQRLVSLSEATARKLKQSEEEIRLIGLAGLLHDIGKIGIPAAILHKSNALTEEEWIIMRSHPETGAQLLVQFGEVFGRLADSVRAHHEHWDGRGYPHGSADGAIPLSARILSVVDAYDAMISSRPYRPQPLSAGEAKTELQRFAGSQFDPRVVKAFLCVLDEQENKPGSSEETNALAMPESAYSTRRAITSKGWQQVEVWRQQAEEWRQQAEEWRQQAEEWQRGQLTVQQRKEVLQQRKEVLQQQRQHLAWQKQVLER